ncbi:NUDIX domain-containing protein [Verrucomicrobiota bacterium]
MTMDLLDHTAFLHCPRCASKEIASHEGKAMKCPTCNFLYFHNCASAVAGILEYDAKIVLGVRARDPLKGMLDLPGGFVDYNESLEEALAREIHEELNIKPQAFTYFSSSHNEYEYRGVNYFCNVAFFRCRLDSLAGIRADDDFADFQLFDPIEIPFDQVAFSSVRKALQKLK